jgi:hypothetical protein
VNDTCYSQKLEDLLGDQNKDYLFSQIMSDMARGFFGFVGVLTLLAAVALLPCSLVLLIVAQGELVMRLASAVNQMLKGLCGRKKPGCE